MDMEMLKTIYILSSNVGNIDLLMLKTVSTPWIAEPGTTAAANSIYYFKWHTRSLF